ncbi:phospholipid carrier-dependent glycosyltransferase [archaeon]|jgi:hypothetical protein|nr:phospholipid carrier-dependent glycosyltransferase [archaeon]MBT6761649.1 phospholipid carrier-dependent glycosyltransferase [archaeon]
MDSKISSMFKTVKNNWIIISILIIALVFRLVHLNQNFNLWWDSSIYLGVSKYIYTLGSSGIWEPYRPLIHPILLGFFWKIGANVVWVGKFLDLIFSLTTIILSYKIAKRVYSKKAAYYTAFILAIAPLSIMFTGLILTEPLALTLCLAAVYLFINRETILPSWKNKYKNLMIGTIFAIAALTKFPLAMIFFSTLIARQIIARKQVITKHQIIKQLKESIFLLFGFSIPFIPYLILNYILYSDPLLPFTSGSWIVGTFLWQYDTNFWFYFTDFFPVYQLFAIIPFAIILFIINKDYKNESKTLIVTSSTLLFLYFWLIVPRKEIRYLIMLYPFWIILISDIIAKVETRISQLLFQNDKLDPSEKKSNTQKSIFQKFQPFLAVVIIITAIIGAQVFPAANISYTTTVYDSEIELLGDYIIENKITEPILSSSPYIIEHVDNLIYPTADISLANAVYERKAGDYSYILVRDCDYVCHSSDTECKEEKEKFLNRIDNENNLLQQVEYNFKRNICILSFYSIGNYKLS